jgi:flagellar protein FlbD
VIPLTRLNGKEFLLNPELIETLEATPDTVVTLRGGVRHMVRESTDEVSQRILAYRRQCLSPAAAVLEQQRSAKEPETCPA